MSADPLAALRARFVERALQDASTLEAALKKDDHQAMEQVAHSLAGAAGVFGFADLGEAARLIDDRYAAGGRPSVQNVRDLVAQARMLQS